MWYACLMEYFAVKPLKRGPFVLDVPASKSLAGRALLLAAFLKGETFLEMGELGEDPRTMLSALRALGIRCEEEEGGIRVFGCGGHPLSPAEISLGSAGTVARFLPTMLAFTGGEYTFTLSEQMARRPMDHLALLEEAGAEIEMTERGFRMRSRGIGGKFLVDTNTSTQFASGLLLAAAAAGPASLRLTGSRTHGSYLRMTEALITSFGAKAERKGEEIAVSPALSHPPRYAVEPDVSAACYFYALSLLLGECVTVRGVHLESLQGDVAFLRLLEEKGVRLRETPLGLEADGREISSFTGFDADMKDFSDQALTVAALAPFAATPSRLRGIGHIRRQECDRLEAMRVNFGRMGVPCRIREDGIEIDPAPIGSCVIETFGDHRVAMAFSLCGLRGSGIVIADPACCKKTFGRYFDILRSLERS